MLKITVLTPNLSGNCLGRAYILAKMLSKRWPVEIAGPMFGENIWFPVREDEEITYKYVKLKKNSHFLCNVEKLLKQMNGDVVYASKPLMTSYGTGILFNLLKRKPLVLDIDDWERGFLTEAYEKLSALQKFKNPICSLWDYSYYWNISFMEKLIGFSKEITVSNSFLQKKFGGTIIPHARDTAFLDPDRYDSIALKKQYGLSEKKVISFIGSPKKHKGISELIESVKLVNNPDAVLMIVGVEDRETPVGIMAKEKLSLNKVALFGKQEFSKLGEFLAISDVVVVPQQDNQATWGQFPAKIFDAMAMAKPVVSTAVNDIPNVLHECGVVVPAGDIKKMADSIKMIIEDESRGVQLGKKAREKCVEYYSYSSVSKILINLFEKYEK